MLISCHCQRMQKPYLTLYFNPCIKSNGLLCTRTKWFICALVWAFFYWHSKAMFLLWTFFVIYVCVFHAVLSVQCSLVATCWVRAGLLALLYVMFSCVIVTFPCVVLCQVWYLIVSNPDFYLLLNYIYHEWASIKNCLFMLSTKHRYSNQHTCYV